MGIVDLKDIDVRFNLPLVSVVVVVVDAAAAAVFAEDYWLIYINHNYY